MSPPGRRASIGRRWRAGAAVVMRQAGLAKPEVMPGPGNTRAGTPGRTGTRAGLGRRAGPDWDAGRAGDAGRTARAGRRGYGRERRVAAVSGCNLGQRGSL